MPYSKADIKHFDDLGSDDHLYYCPDCDLYWEENECQECGLEDLDTFIEWSEWKREGG